MSRQPATVAEEYASRLQALLSGGGEPALHEAYETGRRALEQGVGVVELVSAHLAAVDRITASCHTRDEALMVLRTAGAFLVEALSPFEMTHRGFRDANAALRRINERLEEEARRIAQTIHDETGPSLVSMHLSLKELLRAVPEPALPAVRCLRDDLFRIEEHIRHLARELRPPTLDQLGLLGSLRFLVEGVSSRNGVRIEIEECPERRLPASVETAIYRTAQEALTNAIRHARASRIGVTVAVDGDHVRCSIVDDGLGFDAGASSGPNATAGLGLLGIRERADALRGTFRIVSVPGKGTEVHLSLPLEA